MTELTEFETRVLKLFHAAVSYLRVDSEGCAPSEWDDVIRASNLCADMRLWCLQGLMPTLAKSDALFEGVGALEQVLTTFVIVAPSNAELVTRWRAAYAQIAELDAA